MEGLKSPLKFGGYEGNRTLIILRDREVFYPVKLHNLYLVRREGVEPTES